MYKCNAAAKSTYGQMQRFDQQKRIRSLHALQMVTRYFVSSELSKMKLTGLYFTLQIKAAVRRFDREGKWDQTVIRSKECDQGR